MGCTVKKFLCCISLETGGLIVGWINVILSFLAIIGLIVLLSLEVINYNHGSSSSQMNVVGSFVCKVEHKDNFQNIKKIYFSFDDLLFDFHHLLSDRVHRCGKFDSRNKKGKQAFLGVFISDK